jgi:hypothetical protein
MTEREKFEKWAGDNLKNVTIGELFDMRSVVAFRAWQAALSTRKPYGYGIVDKDGKNAVSILLTEIEAKNYVATYQLHCPEKEFKAVPLFYEDQS